MKPTEGKVVATTDTEVTEEVLLTYSEEEKQRHRTNAANARLVFKPLFIPFYPRVKQKYELTDIETLLFGFIAFFTSSASERFYFNNDQLSELLECAPRTITSAMGNLEKKGLVKVGRRMKAGGGQIRFVKLLKDKGILQIENFAS